MRLDTALVHRNLYPTRAKAAAAIKGGLVSINGKIANKSSTDVDDNDHIDATPLPYISGRGGLKLAHALDEFKIDPTGMRCLDIGSSTGGFTEVLLNRGATRVIAVEVGTAQMIDELKNDPRVTLLEETDIRDLTPMGSVDLIVIDVSFISLTEIMDAIVSWESLTVIALIKPQFEVPKNVAKRADGIIKSKEDRMYAIDTVVDAFRNAGYAQNGLIESPIKGGSGNVEYLGLFQRTNGL
ncbi:TlyA family RNA methyltransferase [Lachnospiraceae bacterium OttesenSCG-928-E19]|nr:TlyA family RNA methyltransferase [Lachnospiraceae bacterium OttesenSCG-928-E19]